MTEIIPETEKWVRNFSCPCVRSTFFLMADLEGCKKTLLIFPRFFLISDFLSRSISLTQLEPDLNLSELFSSFRSIQFRFLESKRSMKRTLTNNFSLF